MKQKILVLDGVVLNFSSTVSSITTLPLLNLHAATLAKGLTRLSIQGECITLCVRGFEPAANEHFYASKGRRKTKRYPYDL